MYYHHQISLLFLPLFFFLPSNPCVATSPTTTATTTVATTTCTTCTTAQIGIVTGNDGDFTPTSTTGTNAAGCSTLTYTCERNPVVATDVVLITYYSNSLDVGTENGDGSATATLTCVDGQWENTNVVINEIECQIIT